MLYNKDATMLYKDTEIRYCNDEEVDAGDLTAMCNLLYQRELLNAFDLFDDEVNFEELTNKMEQVYEHVKMDPEIMDMIQRNFFQDEVTTFISLFSYDTFHLVHKLICKCLP
jgi:hypothetical protein